VRNLESWFKYLLL